MRPLSIAILCSLTLASSANSQTKKGENFAFMVACKKYANSVFPELPFTIKETAEFRQVLLDSGFAEGNIKFLNDGQTEPRYQPQGRMIVKELDVMLSRVKEEDTLLVVLNGHGLHFKKDSVTYFQPVDADVANKSTMLPLEGPDGIFTRLERCKAKRKLLLVNACRNQVGDFGMATAKDTFDDTETDTAATGIATLYSCQPGQRSYYYPPKDKVAASPGHQRSLFFHHLINAWQGDYVSEGKVTLDHVISEVEKRVAADADAILGESQLPLPKRAVVGNWVVRDTKRVAAAETKKAPAKPLLAAGDVFKGEIESTASAQDRRIYKYQMTVTVLKVEQDADGNWDVTGQADWAVRTVHQTSIVGKLTPSGTFTATTYKGANLWASWSCVVKGKSLSVNYSRPDGSKGTFTVEKQDK